MSALTRPTDLLGQTVKLHQARAYKMPENEEMTISRSVTFEDWHPVEPSNYCWEAGWTVYDRQGQEFFLPMEIPDYDCPSDWDEGGN